MTNSTIGTRLQSARKIKGLSASALARAARVSPSFISKLESGALVPQRRRAAALEDIARALDVTVDHLLFGDLVRAGARPTPPHLLKEVQEVRAFTALVEGLKKAERAPEEARRAAWRILSAASESIRVLIGWTPEDWESAIVLDHWKKLTKEPEELTIRRALD